MLTDCLLSCPQSSTRSFSFLSNRLPFCALLHHAFLHHAFLHHAFLHDRWSPGSIDTSTLRRLALTDCFRHCADRKVSQHLEVMEVVSYLVRSIKTSVKRFSSGNRTSGYITIDLASAPSLSLSLHPKSFLYTPSKHRDLQNYA